MNSRVDANNFCELYGVTKQDVMDTMMTPREKLVLMLLSGGMSVAEIVRQGNVRALEGKKQPVSSARVHQIKSKALRKIRQRIRT